MLDRSLVIVFVVACYILYSTTNSLNIFERAPRLHSTYPCLARTAKDCTKKSSQKELFLGTSIDAKTRITSSLMLAECRIN